MSGKEVKYPKMTHQMVVCSNDVGTLSSEHKMTLEHAVEGGDGAAAHLNSPQEH